MVRRLHWRQAMLNHDNWEDEPTNPFKALEMARVLVAEDDDALRGMMVARLRNDGCEVIEARTGDEALDVITSVWQGTGPVDGLDLLVMDVRMPGLSGIEIAYLMRSWRVCAPVLFVTAYPEPDLLAEVHQLQGRIIAKPFGLSRLSTAANEALRARLS
jgi:CheY-like chemotaxis protein